MYKICSKCKEEKLLGDFYKNKSQKDGFDNQCKCCKQQYYDSNKLRISLQRKEYLKKYEAINKDVIAAYKKEYRKLNKEKFQMYEQEYRETNKEKISIKQQEYRKANPSKNNAYAAKRRAIKIQATPNWLTKEDFEKISEFYRYAKELQLTTGDCYHVDHIIPLNGKDVCGLHVPWNLQVIPAKENLSKSNKLIQE